MSNDKTLSPEEKEQFRAWRLQQIDSKEKIIELMKKAPLWARKHGLMTQAEWSLLVVNHPKARQIVDKMVEIYLYDQFLRKIGKLPKEEE